MNRSKNKWIKAAMASVDAAFRELQRMHPSAPRSGLAWGFGSKMEEDEEIAARSEGFHARQDALISWLNHYFSLSLVPTGDKDLPPLVAISAALHEWEKETPFQGLELRLPTDDPRKLYNILSVCRHASLRIVPENDGIAIVGVRMECPLPQISGMVLGHLLSEVSTATSLLWKLLAGLGHDDWWSMDGGV